MEFLLTTQGLLYNGPALILLAYLIWSRPLTVLVVALVAAVRVFGPPFGVGHWVPFDVHGGPCRGHRSLLSPLHDQS